MTQHQTSPEKSQPGRAHRITRRIGITLVAALTTIGAVATYQFFFGALGVGHFRSIDGRTAYVDAYDRAMSALPPPTTVHDVTTDFGTVRAYEWSSPDTADTPPVVLVPGRSSGVPMWAENLPGFLPHHRVLAFDALGDAGLSVQNVPLKTSDDQALWIHDALTRLGVGDVHIVGHSFGGATAATYAKSFPENVRSLTLLEPVFTFASPPARMLGWAMVSTLPFLPDSWIDTALGKIGGVDDYDPDDAMAVMISRATQHFSAALPTPSPLDDEEIGVLTMPTYVAVAEHDSIAGGEKAASRARELPNAVVEVFADTTHSLPMQAKERLDAELREFWARAED